MRIYTLDRLRILAALLRCVLHTLIPYMATRTGMWPFQDSNRHVLLPDVLVFNIHSFIMEAFYFLSGYLAWQQWQRYGSVYFARERALRVALPFIIGLVLLVPLVIFMFPWGAQWEAGRFTWQPALWARDALPLIRQNLYPTAHLWFLFYLLLYYGMVLGLGKLRPLPAIPAWLLAAGIWLAMVFCYQWHAQWIIKNPLLTRVEGATFLYYLLFFGLGWLLAPRGAYWLQKARQYRWWLLGGWLLLCGLAPALQLQARAVTPFECYPPHLLATAVASAQTLLGLAGFTGLLHIPRPLTARGQWWVASSYWVYLTHMPMAMLCQLLLLPLSWPLWIKFVIALATSLGLCLFTYQWFGKKLLGLLKPAKPIKHVPIP